MHNLCGFSNKIFDLKKKKQNISNQNILQFTEVVKTFTFLWYQRQVQIIMSIMRGCRWGEIYF